MSETATRQEFHPIPFGQYLLLERIGTGGMAEIFRAKTFGAYGFEKEYAIKRILPNLGADDEFVSMFVNEAKLVVDLYHANIVQVFDLGQIDAAYFIAMEFVQGKDLLDLLARCAENDLKIPLKLTLFVIMEMLKGLDFTHNASDRWGEPLNIIHRDVSPSNVMLSYGGDVKIGDFGVAKAKTQTQMTDVGTLKGKVGYMSPEQVRGDEIDKRSDVFAAGIILYEALTMSRLFMGGNDLDVMLKIRDSDVEEELLRCRKIPPSLLAILRKALAKGVDDRFQSSGELYSVLRDFVYRHSIMTSSQDLAAFLKLVFRDEIEAEQNRRLEDPTSREILGEDNSSPSQGIAYRERSARIPLSVSGPLPLPELEESSTLDSLLPDLPIEPETYRYQAANGETIGPMTLEEMQALLTKQVENEEELVSIDDGGWVSPDDIPQLWGIERLQSTEFTEEVSTLTGITSVSTDNIETAERTPVPSLVKPVSGNSGSKATHGGNLVGTTLSRLLYRLTRHRSTGMFRIESNRHRKDIYFQRGTVIMVTSTMAQELLGTYLIHRGVISDEELNQALERLSEFGGRLGDALVGERIVPTHELFRYLSEQLHDRIIELFTWRAGEWSWVPDIPPPQESSPLGLEMIDLIMDGIRTRIPPPLIRQQFTGREHEHLDIAHSHYSFEDLPFEPNELEVASTVKSGIRPTDLVEKLGAQRGAAAQLVWRVLYFLTEFEFFRLGETGEEQRLPG